MIIRKAVISPSEINPYRIEIEMFSFPPGKEMLVYKQPVIQILNKGEYRLSSAGRAVTVGERALVFFDKGTFAAEIIESISGCLIRLEPAFIKTFLKTHLPNQSEKTEPLDLWQTTLEEDRHGLIRGTIEKIISEPEFKPCMARVTIHQLFIELLAGNGRTEFHRYLVTASESADPSPSRILSEYLFRDLTNKEMASLCALSESSLYRYFRENYRKTPGEWVRIKRLERASFLLRNTKKNVTEIAFETGFKDSSHFSRSFSRQFGIPPAEYRKKTH